jgi:hypothetical protein
MDSIKQIADRFLESQDVNNWHQGKIEVWIKSTNPDAKPWKDQENKCWQIWIEGAVVGQFRNKILYPKIEWAYVNTKI